MDGQCCSCIKRPDSVPNSKGYILAVGLSLRGNCNRHYPVPDEHTEYRVARS